MRLKKSNPKRMPEILILILVGFTAGTLSGIIGIGGGVIMVPALVMFLGFSQHEAQGTTLAMMLPPIGALAVINYYRKDLVNFEVAAWLVTGFFIGAFLGSRWAVSMPEQLMKKIFGIIMALIALKMILGK